MAYYEYANLTLEDSDIPCQVTYTYTSGACHGMTHDRTMVNFPDGGTETLMDKTSLIPTLLQSTTENVNSDTAPRIMMTTNYMFIFSVLAGGGDAILYRIDINTQEQGTYNPEGAGNCSLENFTVYDDNTVYTIEEHWSATYDVLRLYKVTFVGITTTSELIYEMDCYPGLYSSLEYNYDLIIDLLYFKYEETKTIIFFSKWDAVDYPDSAAYENIFRFWIYNIDTGNIDDQWLVPAPDSGYSYDLFQITWDCTPPAFYNNKMIITVGLPSLSTADPNYLTQDPRPWFTTIFVDIFNNSITQLYDWENSNGEWNWLYEVGGIIDYNTGTYYFEAWVEELTGYYLFTVDLTSPISQTFTGIETSLEGEYGFHYFQTNRKCYGVDRNASPGSCNVYDLFDMSIVTSITVDYEQFPAHYFESGIAVDVMENMLWSFRSNMLEGKSLTGGSNRNITVSWESGTVPFSYSNNRAIHYRILDNAALAMVSSSVGSTYQLDFYLLK